MLFGSWYALLRYVSPASDPRVKRLTDGEMIFGLLQNILPSDYYTSHLLVSRADQQVLKDLVDRTLPKLSAHLEEQGVELSAITFGWFLSLFTDCLPIQVRFSVSCVLDAVTDELTTLVIADVAVRSQPRLSPTLRDAFLTGNLSLVCCAAASGTCSSSTGPFFFSASRSRSSSCTSPNCSSATRRRGCTPCSVSSRLDCGTLIDFSRCVLPLFHSFVRCWPCSRSLMDVSWGQVACDDLASAVKDRVVASLRNKHVRALEAEMGIGAGGDDDSLA